MVGKLEHVNSDPRYIRSQSKLFNAIISLATDLPLEKITVTAIADKAGVHRSTVYEHADSPKQLLHKAITQELNDNYTFKGPEDVSNNQVKTATEAVLRYLESHEGLFSRMSTESGAEIRDILRSHFMKSLISVLEFNNFDMPETTVEISKEDFRLFTVYTMAEMHVGIFAAALTYPKPRSAELLYEMIRVTTPYWWKWENIT